MSFSKGNNDSTKTPWVEVTVPSRNNNANNVNNAIETERLLSVHHDEDRPTMEAIPCVDVPQKESEMDHSEYPKAVVAASGTAGCVLGCLVGGVVCAVMGGLGSAYAAKHKAGTCLGDTARAMGEVALVVHEKAVNVNQKHDVVKTTQEAARNSYEKAKALDQEYHICKKGKNAIATAGKATIDFAARHQLVERSVEGVGHGMKYVGNRITSSGVRADVNQNRSLS